MLKIKIIFIIIVIVKIYIFGFMHLVQVPGHHDHQDLEGVQHEHDRFRNLLPDSVCQIRKYNKSNRNTNIINIPCLMHGTRLCRIDLIVMNN